MDDEQRERIREQRRKRYQEDEEYRERVKASNRRYIQRRRDEEPDKGAVFDKMLAQFKEKWDGDENE